MTDFFIRKFIKNSDQVQDAQVRASYGIFGSIVGIICNLLLFVLKYIVGTAIHSMAVTADAFNNLSDMASSVISLLGVRMTSRPADREHPFGHGRMEYIAALIVSFIIIDVGLNFLKESVSKIRQPEEMYFSTAAFILLLVSVGVKLWMAAFNRKLAGKIHSEVLKATATDSLFDAITTSVTILSLLIYHFSGINIDGIAGLAVSLIVLWGGVGMVRDTVTPLIGEQMDPETEKKITELIKKDPVILGTHDLVIHSYGPSSSMATIHIEVSSKMSLEEAHAAADRAEKEVLKQLGIILVVHVDPVDLNDERTVKIRGQITRILRILDKELSFHDLQITFTEDENIISFDLVVPYKYGPKDEERVLFQVMAFMRELSPKNECAITLDRGVMEEIRRQ